MKRVIIFDWDGVIVDSNTFKWEEAWKKTFKKEKEKASLAAEYLSTPEGRALSRYELIEKIAPKSSKSYQNKIAEEFSNVLQQSVAEISLMLNIQNVLDFLQKKGYKMIVISATKEEDLKYQADYLNVSKYFTDLFGNPRTKIENFERIENLKKHQYVVIGDGEGDYKLAKSIEAEFIGVENKWNNWGSDKVMKKYVVPILNISDVILNFSK